MAALGAGCTAPAEKPASPTWNGPSEAASAPPFVEPAAYSYVLTRGCDPAAPVARYRATVRDGVVVTSERLDAAIRASPSDPPVDLGPIGGEDGEEIEVPALGQLLQIAETASEDGGAVTTTFDAKDGHPVTVVVDVEEPECFSVSEYRPG
ncbi:hypothetical protein [Paractinoplanes rishiriensis]|uniref:Uncharacterized protein n=1 Tax=Paractinoplanes rishiriensis TaxID=1050105 RepID=A0A919JYG1_9ACTN|nr:hypothetical protein [Actinoplanes rishiriensis]GIE97048.1 hypothetical protein Ari01nite_45130 [Actinoplanes rishiriensis]